MYTKACGTAQLVAAFYGLLWVFYVQRRMGVTQPQGRLVVMLSTVASSKHSMGRMVKWRQPCTHQCVYVWQVMELDNTCSELRKEIKAAEGRAQVITDLQDKLRLLELQLQSAQQVIALATYCAPGVILLPATPVSVSEFKCSSESSTTKWTYMSDGGSSSCHGCCMLVCERLTFFGNLTRQA
jgi:hypothetical protein